MPGVRVTIATVAALLLIGGCRPAAVLETASDPPNAFPTTATPAPAFTPRATQTARSIAPTSSATPTTEPVSSVWTPIATLAATLDPQYVTPFAGFEQERLAAYSLIDAAPASGDHAIMIGHSVEGRPITARQFGHGERIILLVGGIHGGYEANTVRLVEQLLAHFEAYPGDVLPGIRLVLLPVANPDGLLRGSTAEGRFNSRGVDLNRNWGCDWSPEAVWQTRAVYPGPHPFSEPESQALAAFIRQLRPVVALFYHSAANGVFAGHCNGEHGSAAMAAVYGEATGYAYGARFSAYRVSGTAASWADGEGIAAADVELQSRTDSEFERNLRGLMALQRWLLGGT